MGVVASIPLGGIYRRACDDVVEVDVGIGGEGIVEADLLARGVGEGIAVGAPGEFLRATEGLGGRFVGLTL